jgi:single-strand DNA-binding protein
MNRVTLMGRLGRDPELTYTPQGTAVAKFGLAVSEYVKDGDNKTTWFNIVIFGKRAEVAAEHLRKGNGVLIEGKIQINEWEQDGCKRTGVEIVGGFQFLPKGGE